VVLGGLAACSVVAAVIVAVLLVTGAVGGNSDDEGSADEIAQKVSAAIKGGGQVYHVVGSDGSVTWIDAANQEHRRRDADAEGGLTSVGEGWTRYSYDPQDNQVRSEDLSANLAQRPRIDEPFVSWSAPLAALAFSRELRMIGKTTADGVAVIALEASTPVVDSRGNQTGTLYGRVEVDAETYLPHSYQRRQTNLDGTTPTPAIQGQDPNVRVTYENDFIDRSTLAADFFDRSIVEKQVKTNADALRRIRDDLGLTPLWFGQYKDVEPYGEVQLPPTISVNVDTRAGTADIAYALVSPTIQSEAAVIIRLAADTAGFTSPEIPEFAGDLPEVEEAVTLPDGSTGQLYSSILTVEALPCPQGGCPASDAVLYRRLVFTRGETAVQIEVSPRVDETGADLNGFNSRDGILALAGALVEAPEDVVLPTPAP
jgi:hypothetical protein